ncbi:hypothetical protein C3766_12750 [Heyndrickxia coagulans]|nr:hypothetical protein C3766_12750 [Heyndrickxia coagulans]
MVSISENHSPCRYSIKMWLLVEKDSKHLKHISGQVSNAGPDRSEGKHGCVNNQRIIPSK